MGHAPFLLFFAGMAMADEQGVPGKDTVGAVGELILVFYYDFFMGYVLKSYT